MIKITNILTYQTTKTRFRQMPARHAGYIVMSLLGVKLWSCEDSRTGNALCCGRMVDFRMGETRQ